MGKSSTLTAMALLEWLDVFRMSSFIRERVMVDVHMTYVLSSNESGYGPCKKLHLNCLQSMYYDV